MKKIKLYPSPHIGMTPYVSEQMEKDMKECYEKALGKGKSCKNCSWNDVKPYGVSMCEIEEVVDKIILK